MPLLVDHGRVLDEEGERLPAGEIRAYRPDEALPFEILADLLGLLAGALGQLLDLGADLVVVDLDRLLGDHGAQREVGAHGPRGRLAQLGEELLLVLPGGGEVLRDADALADLLLEAVREVVQAALHLLARRGSSGISISTRSAAASSTFSRTASCACTLA